MAIMCNVALSHQQLSVTVLACGIKEQVRGEGKYDYVWLLLSSKVVVFLLVLQMPPAR